MERSCCHGDDVMTQLSSLSEQLELMVTIEQIDSVSNLLSDFAQLQIDRIHHAPQWSRLQIQRTSHRGRSRISRAYCVPQCLTAGNSQAKLELLQKSCHFFVKIVILLIFFQYKRVHQHMKFEGIIVLSLRCHQVAKQMQDAVTGRVSNCVLSINLYSVNLMEV